MTTPIERVLSLLSPTAYTPAVPQKARYAGAVQSPVKGTTKAVNPLRAFADSLGIEAGALGKQGGFDLAAPQAPELPPSVYTQSGSQHPGNVAAVFKRELLAGGLPPHAVEGIMMNGQDESGFNPAAIGDNGSSIGILQLHGPRKLALEAFAAARGTSVSDPVTQAKFTLSELHGPERAALDAITSARTAGEAGAAFVNLYERPAEEHRKRRAAQYLSGVAGDFIAPSNVSFGDDLPKEVPDSRDSKDYPVGVPIPDGSSDKKFTPQGGAGAVQTAMEQFFSLPPDSAATPAQEQADNLANTVQAGAVAPQRGTAPAASGGGGESTPRVSPPPAAQPKKAAETPSLTAVDKLFDSLYGTKPADMTNAERADRRRAVGLALSQGFHMLSSGDPMDIQPIVQQRMELQTARRAAADLQSNAQGVSDMLVASGLQELAQLPFAGESGMSAAMNALVTHAAKGSGNAPFDLPPAVRATVAQTMADMGHGGLAEQIMRMPAGPALEDLYKATLGATPEDGASGYTPEQREQLASQFDAAGNSFAASAIRNGLDDKSIGDLVKDQGGVAPAVQQAAGVAGVQADVAANVDARSAEELAAGYDRAGLHDEAAVARAAGSGPEAKQAVADMRADKLADKEEKAIKERGNAVAELIPDTLENAEQLRAVARAAKTSQDLDGVYEQIADDPKTTEEQLYNLSGKDPAFLPFLTELMRAKAGTTAPVPISTQLVLNEVSATAENYRDSIAGRKVAETNMQMLRQAASNPDFTPGKVQGSLAIPLQQWADSILGDAAPDIASDADMTVARLVEVVRAGTFVAMSSGLKGAISDRETAYFVATSPSITDTRTQMLAVAQYHLKVSAIQEAEYDAMREWVSIAEKNGSLGDRKAMIDYVNSKVGDMKVFDRITADDLDDKFDENGKLIKHGWFDDPARQIGEVVEVVRPDGSSAYVSYTLGD